MREYAIYDSKLGEFQPPVLRKNNAVALRDFEQLVNTPGNPVFDAPADYQLYCKGEHDAEKGMTSYEIPFQLLANGATLVAKEARDVDPS